MTHNGERRAYEVTLGPAAIRTKDGLSDPADWDYLEYALQTELVDGPNADKESNFDREGQPLSEHSADSGDLVYTATPLSFQAYTAVHRALTKDELDRLADEQGRLTHDCGRYVIDILAAELAFTRRPGGLASGPDRTDGAVLRRLLGENGG
jgi:hypothetical protein